MRLLLSILLCLFWNSTETLANHQWVQKADFGTFGRHRAIGVGIGNKAYVGMGHLNGDGFDTWYSDWWEYDPATNAWTQRADYIGNAGNGDQDIVAVGFEYVGFVGLGQLDGNGFYKYDSQLNVWTAASSPPPSASFNNIQAFSIGDKGYFPALFSNEFYEYDHVSDTWTLLGLLPFTTYYGTPTFKINGKGYIKDAANFWEYDPATNIWIPKALFPGLSPNRPKGFSQNGRGYFIGGMTPGWEWSPNVWSYNPANDSWTQLDDFPGTTRRWAVVMNIGDRVFYGLGTNGTNFNDFWEFDSVADIDEFDQSSFNTYPTLANKVVNFTSEEHRNFEIRVFNLLGEEVSMLATDDGTARLNRGNLNAGTYLYHVRIAGQTIFSNRFVFR